MTLPDSNQEKHAETNPVDRIAHWLYVHELRALLDNLQPTDVLLPNDVNNLSIQRADSPYGWIDFAFNAVETYADLDPETNDDSR